MQISGSSLSGPHQSSSSSNSIGSASSQELNSFCLEYFKLTAEEAKEKWEFFIILLI